MWQSMKIQSARRTVLVDGRNTLVNRVVINLVLGTCLTEFESMIKSSSS